MNDLIIETDEEKVAVFGAKKAKSENGLVTVQFPPSADKDAEVFNGEIVSSQYISTEDIAGSKSAEEFFKTRMGNVANSVDKVMVVSSRTRYGRVIDRVQNAR